MRKIWKTAVAAVGFLAIAFLLSRATGEFDTEGLLIPDLESSKWKLSKEQNSFDIETLLSMQTFHYLDKGHQAFVFLSEDEQYVLKLFKPDYPRVSFLGAHIRFTWIPFAKSTYRILAKSEIREKIQKDFASYVNAFQKMKEETQLEYLHLAESSDLHSKIRIFDKIKAYRELDPNKTCFLIQKKVSPLYERLEGLILKNQKEEAKQLLRSLLDLLVHRIELGFYKPTHKFYANFGAIGLKAIQFDVGRLLTYEELNEEFKAVSLSSLHNSTDLFKQWLEKRDPELSIYWTKSIQDIEK